MSDWNGGWSECECVSGGWFEEDRVLVMIEFVIMFASVVLMLMSPVPLMAGLF